MQAWLERARYAEERIEAVEELIARARSRMEGSRQAGAGGGGGSAKRDFSDALARIERYEDERRRIQEAYDEVREAIDALSNERHRTALELYYLRDYEWTRVAEALGYDERTMTRWHAAAKAEIAKRTGV